MRVETLLRSVLLALLAGLPAMAPAQVLEDLRATTIEAAPAAQISAAEATLKQLRDALAQCDGGRLYGLLPAWERQVLPALIFDAVHAGEDGLIAGMGLQQAALSAYGRAVIALRGSGATSTRAVEDVQAVRSWCEANRGVLAALYGDLQSRDWQWLRQDDLQLLSGCARRPVGDGRLSLLWLDDGWRFALLESVETLIPEALAGPDASLREALLAERKGFLDRYRQLPEAPQPADPLAREQLMALEPSSQLDRYATLIAQRVALPPCR
jgi:hypothetical protein